MKVAVNTPSNTISGVATSTRDQTKAFKPKSIKAWLIQLTKEPLPILPHTGKHLLAQLNDPDIALNHFAGLVMQDPVLTLHILRQANKLNKNEFTDITNIHHTVTLLGLTNIQKLSRHIPVLESKVDDLSYLHYMTAVMRSVHAAEQARTWAVKKSYHSPDEIYLAALLYAVPMWCLWRFATHEMNLIEHLIVKERVPKKEAEMVVLGCTTEKICQALAKLWSFPEVVRDALDTAKHPSQRFVIATARASVGDAFPELPAYDPNGIAINSPAVQVLLANWLATETDIDWYSRQTTRCIRVLSAFLKMQEWEAYRLVRQQAITTSRKYPIPGIHTPASYLVLLAEESVRRTIKLSQLGEVTQKLSDNWELIESGSLKNVAEIVEQEARQLADSNDVSNRDRASDVRLRALSDSSSRNGVEQEKFYREIDGPQLKQSPKAEQEPHKVNSERGSFEQKTSARSTRNALPSCLDLILVKKFIQQLRVSRNRRDDITEFLSELCKVLHDGVGLERVVATLINKRGTKLRAVTSAGLDENSHLNNLEISLESHSLFARLLIKPAGIWIDPSANVKALSLVPQQFIQDCGTEQFLLQSIFNGTGPVAVIHADRGAGKLSKKLRPEQYKTFKLVCAEVNEYLGRPD